MKYEIRTHIMRNETVAKFNGKQERNHMVLSLSASAVWYE